MFLGVRYNKATLKMDVEVDGGKKSDGVVDHEGDGDNMMEKKPESGPPGELLTVQSADEVLGSRVSSVVQAVPTGAVESPNPSRRGRKPAAPKPNNNNSNSNLAIITTPCEFLVKWKVLSLYFVLVSTVA
jgi:hypothetical protein